MAESIQHEQEHLNIYNTFGIMIQYRPPTDPDGDAIPSTNEWTYGGISTVHTNADTYNVDSHYPGGNYYLYGDNDLRCRLKEMVLSVQVRSDKDWSNPGSQNINQGP